MINTMLEFLQEASKVLHLDASHSALRQKLQAHVDMEHRKTIAADGATGGYYDTPYIHDVYGTEDAGQVVTSHKGQMHAQKFSKSGDTYKLGDKKRVKQAYVMDNDADDKKESLTVILDGRTLEMQETASTFTEVGDVVELQEAATRPEGDITKLAATTKTDAVYVAGENGKPGRLVAESHVYPEYAPFIAARKDDIGVSVRVGATTNGVKEGVPLVENMVFARSVDFVTKAGRGGRIEEMYESYRAAQPSVQGGNQPQENEMTDQEKAQFAALQTTVSRLQESNAQLRAEGFISRALVNSGLKPRGQERVAKQIMAVLPMNEAGLLDETKLQESIKDAIKDELAYLQESGVAPRPVVRGLGVVPEIKDDGTELSEAEIVTKADELFSESVKELGKRQG